MNVTWGLLTVLSLACHTESRCSPTSYYKNCWIRRFPGIFIDIEESQRRGAQLLKHYQEETALKCSRTCCLTRNFSCNLAIFHYETTEENVNCFHLHCPTLESCILSHRGNVVLYNITKGVDPDLLVFGKYFTSNVRVLPHYYGRVNSSEPLLPSDKRQFIHPAPPPAALPTTSAPTLKPATTTDNTVLISPTTDTATLQITTHLSTVPTSTDALSSTPNTPTFSVNHAQTTTPTISSSTASLAPSFTTPPPASSTVTTLSPYKAETDPAFSDSTPQPSTLATSQLTTTARSGNVESSKQYPNDTKGSGLGRNHTTATEGGQGVTGEGTLGGLGPGWHVAAHTLLVAVAVCVAVLVSCCCSVLMVVSWRGQRKRMGRYRTSFQRKRGSMRLIKYVLVRERDS